MVLELLEGRYKVLRGTSQYLIVVGDAKTFNHLVSLKREHPEKFAWLLPFPGDWHILKNFHPVIVNMQMLDCGSWQKHQDFDQLP